MGIPEKDLKILWGKAAGKCSFCRNDLFHEADNPSDVTLIGENCHIVAEKTKGPRGKSNLSAEDRNRYPNLILLCRNHHKIIDDDVTKYSIPILYKMKTEHEIWVQNCLVRVSDTKKDIFYVELVNEITNTLRLNNWDNISDDLLRNLMPAFFEEAVRKIGAKVFRSVWPKTLPVLESKIINLSNHLDKYVTYFCENGVLRSNCWMENRNWKNQGWITNYHECAEESEKWTQNLTQLLFNIVIALNEFAEQVRTDLDQDYFRLGGKFIVLDSLGVSNDLKSVLYIPENYKDVVLAKINIKPMFEKS